MTKRVLMFPGQGSQKLSMAKDIYEASEQNNLFDRINNQLDFDLLDIMFNDEEKLGLTQYTQPAIVTHSSAILEQLDVEFDFTIGHSLGEYAALVASGVITAEDAALIVAKRGELMSTAFPKGTGGMAAVLGLSADEVKEICDKISTDDAFIEPANLNCPGQVVVSGHQEKIDELVQNGKALGAKRVIALNVSGPFHSRLMEIIEADFRTFIDQFNFNDAKIPVIQNVTARPATKAEDIKEGLIKQLYSPVRFEESINYIIAEGVTEFIEVGPGKVLGGLVKKIDREQKIESIETLEDIKRWNESCQQHS